MNKTIYLLIALILILIIGVLSLIFIYKSKLGTKSLQSKNYKTVGGVISPLEVKTSTDPFQNEIISITGIISDSYQKDGSSYLMIDTIRNDKIVNISVDLGPDTIKISEHTITYDGISSSVESGYTDEYKILAAKDIYTKYSNFRGKVVKVDLLTKLKDSPTPDNCNETCKVRIDEVNQYKSNLSILRSTREIPGNKIIVGAPIEISLSQ